MSRHNPNIFQPREFGVISRSGSLGTLICLNLTRAGIGQSTFLGIGGDPMIGTTTRDALKAIEEDLRARAVVLVGEIGGAMERRRRNTPQACRSPSCPSSRDAPPDRE